MLWRVSLRSSVFGGLRSTGSRIADCSTHMLLRWKSLICDKKRQKIIHISCEVLVWLCVCVVSSFEKFQLQQIHAPRQHCITFLLRQIINNVFGFTIATAASLFTCWKFHTKYLYVGLALNNVFNVRSYAAMIMYWSRTLQHCATCLHKNVYECYKRLFLNRNLVRIEDT